MVLDHEEHTLALEVAEGETSRVCDLLLSARSSLPDWFYAPPLSRPLLPRSALELLRGSFDSAVVDCARSCLDGDAGVCLSA